ncbi:c-type cytochrome [Luteibacter yeojuensis]|uniref:C-type cytochrome n=1 Tax=Luteibacter yeojuensis TaxID=345309 RepID=A0A7X5TPF2_9GAMM|nr:c-type cytochrome [Luteibacter yeojuensis]NID14674.1 c-type cytochrome [Luteibacter yeojuensis]
MNPKACFLLCGVLMSTTISHRVAAADDAAAGKVLYQNQCSACHSVDEDRIGPRHRNVVGRKVASVPGYDYSSALKMLGGAWTPARLDQWLSGTQKMAPGSKMYLEMDDAEQRRLIIAFLESVSGPDDRGTTHASPP